MKLVRRSVTVAAVLVLACTLAWPAKKKNKKDEEPITQVLPLPKDLPMTTTASVERLVFQVAPLSGKGLLTQQMRDALKALLQQNRGATIVKIRAFVAGSGDLRRVGTIISETFTEKKLPLPALTTVQVGGLPLEAAQVVLESTAEDKKARNPNGIALVSGQPASSKDPAGPLLTALRSGGLDAADTLRVTCFVNLLEHAATVRTQVQQAFPSAALNVVQLQRGALDDFVECEAVAALKKTPAQALAYVGAAEGRSSQIAQIAPGRVVITGTQLGFRQQDSDIKLAFDRLGKALETANTNYKNVAMTHIYSLSRGASDKIRKLRFDYYDAARPPASTILLFEGLPSLDASFAIDVIAVGGK